MQKLILLSALVISVAGCKEDPPPPIATPPKAAPKPPPAPPLDDKAFQAAVDARKQALMACAEAAATREERRAYEVQIVARNVGRMDARMVQGNPEDNACVDKALAGIEVKEFTGSDFKIKIALELPPKVVPDAAVEPPKPKGRRVGKKGPPRPKAEKQGNLEAKKISSAIARRHGQAKACYEKGLKKNPGLRGRVTMQFTIRPDGRVHRTKVKNSTLLDANVGRCIAKAMERWRFPKPTGGSVTVAFPFKFEPKHL